MLAIALVAALLSTLGTALPASAVPTSAASDNEATFLTRLNQERVARGLAPMVLDTKLAATARDWSAQMNGRNSLSHDPGLAADASAVEPAWRAVGENVGVGYSAASLHDAFMASTGHRANILGDYNRVGIGVVMNGTKIWVTVRFLRGPAISGTTGLGPPPPPPGVRKALTGDFDGDGLEDVFTYGPGATVDELWFGTPNRSMRQVSVKVSGQYNPVTGDFDGNGRSDILWYAPGETADFIWTWTDGAWASRGLTIKGTYQPQVGDFDGDRFDDLLWYAPGTASDSYWYGQANGTFTAVGTKINGSYRPFVGNLDGQQGDDLFWYAPGTASDFIWYSVGARGRYADVSAKVAGTYTPFTGDFDGQGTDDIFWYAPGAGGDSIWYTNTTRGSYRAVGRSVGGSYVPAAADFDGNHADDVLWFSPSTLAGDPIWWATPGSTSFTGSAVSG